MSTTLLAVDKPVKNEERRAHPRRRFEELTYATFGPDSGGILINLSEGGLRFQGFRVLTKDQLMQVTFRLPGMDTPVEVAGQAIWINESEKGGGLRFTDFSGEARRLIKEWVATGASFAGSPLARGTTEPETIGGPRASERNLVQSPPTVDAKTAPKNGTANPAPRASAWQISAPAPLTATVPSDLAMSVPPRFLLETREPEVQSAPKRQYGMFAAGLLAGCVVVLAAIVGIRMLGSAGRLTSADQAPASAEQRAIGPLDLNSPVDGTGLNDPRSTSSTESFDKIPAAGHDALGKAPGAAASKLAESVKTNGGPLLGSLQTHDSLQKKTADQPSLALQAPRMPAPVPKPEVREPSIGDATPPGFISTADPPAMAPGKPDTPQVPPQNVGPTLSFLAAVPIQHDSPVYPPRAREKHVEGIVKVGATIGINGVPRDLKLVSGDRELGQAAMEAISNWRYVPAVSGGEPVESQTVITLTFKIKP